MSLRPVKRLISSKPTLEGAGVHLCRAFGFGSTSALGVVHVPGAGANARGWNESFNPH